MKMASKGFKVPDTRKMKLSDVLVHVKKAVEFLKNTTDYSTRNVADALNFLRDVRKFDKINSVPKAATKYGLGELYVKMAKALEDHFTSSEKTQGTKNLEKMETLMMNYANRSPELGCDLGKLGAIDYIVSMLEKLVKQPENERRNNRIDSLLGTLHNASYHEGCRGNREVFRKAGAVTTLKKYMDSTRILDKVHSLLILAYIVDEKESEVLGKGDKAVVFLVNLLKEGVEASDHKANVDRGDIISSFSVWEILDGVNHLSINDANKKAVLENGGIPVINRMLMSDFSEEEQRLAVKSLWNLAFEDSVRESDAIKESLKALKSLTGSKDKSLSAASKNALWEITDKSSEKRLTSKAKKEDDQHIMISYNWTHQECALKIRDELVKAGYKVWIDVDKMEDDILDSMADAVMKSEVVLLCMSQPYYASQSCRSEATYAYKKKKPVIPLLVEADYEPEGWLDIMIGTKLYYKVCSDRDMRNNLHELKKAIGRRGQKSASADDSDGPVKARHVESTGASAPRQSNATTWSTERVLKWFDEIKLPQLKSHLDFCDGSDLEDMYEKFSRDANTFEKDCKANFGLEYRDTMRLSSALKKLFK